MLQFLITYKNLILQLSLSLTLTLLLTFLKIAIFFLRGLHTYIHPDNVQSGVRAAIRRPDGPEFDENNAQIFRLKLDEAHLLYLNNESDDKNSGFLVNGVFVPVLLGFAGVSKLSILHGKVAYEKSASRRSEKQLSVLLGAAGLVLGNVICFTFEILSSCSSPVKEVALFMAWWILFVWTIYSSATIFLYRRCILYVS
ncbi:unnamed protein product [Malus baccata var. baccata]